MFLAFRGILRALQGPNFKYKGIIYYDYEIQRARAYYNDWCIPLFDDGAAAKLLGPAAASKFSRGQQGMYNYTCSFLMTGKGTYFISPDFPFAPNRCCYFGDIPPPTPDWVKNTQWNGTESLRGQMCNVWYFPGTEDPDNPYYAYWSRIDRDNTPVRFLGLSSIGVTILDYTTFKKGPVPLHLLEVPENCSNDCLPPPSL